MKFAQQQAWPAVALAVLFGAAASRAVAQRDGRVASAAPTVNFSFDNADVRLLIRLVGEVTGRRFVVDERVSGQVTVMAPGPLPAEELYPLFLAVLEARGFTVIERDGTSFVVPLPERTVVAPPVYGPQEALGEGWVTRLFKLEHVDAVEAARGIEPLVRHAKAGGLAVFASSNHLVVTDSAPNVRRIAAVLAELDQPGAARAIEVMALKHASAEDVAVQVMAAMTGAQRAGVRVSQHLRQVAEGRAGAPAESLVIPAPHANSLLLVGSPIALAEMKRIIELLDVESPSATGGRLNAIFLQYLAAEDAAKSLNAVLARATEKDARQRISIEASAPNNALLIEASPRDFQWLKELVSELDRPPQQVMIEILIAEVTLGSQLDLGVEWSTIEAPRDGATTIVGRSRPGETDSLMKAVMEGVFPQGLAVGVARGLDARGRPRVPFLLEALQKNRDVRILSHVPLWAQNNREASVSVVDNIPLLRSTIEGGSGAARDIIQNIDRVDVGIKLRVTPQINPDRRITMQLHPSIEAIIDPGPADTRFAPTIAKRELQTTVTVADEETVVLGGLIRQDRIRRVSRVPLLGDIPLLGHLFRYTTDQTQRNNLLVFVTPRIVGERDRAQAVQDDLERRAGVRAETPGAGVLPE